MQKKNDEKLMIFDVFIDIQSKSKNLGTSKTRFSNVKSVPLLSVTPSTIFIEHDDLTTTPFW